MNANVITPRARAGFYGVFSFLGCVAVLAVVAFVGVVLADVAEKRAAVVAPVSDWSNAKLLGELGEAAQVGPCEYAEGFTARFYPDEVRGRLVVVCTPASP